MKSLKRELEQWPTALNAVQSWQVHLPIVGTCFDLFLLPFPTSLRVFVASQNDEAIFCHKCGTRTALGNLDLLTPKVSAPPLPGNPNSSNSSLFQVQLPYDFVLGQILQVVVPPGYAQSGQVVQVAILTTCHLPRPHTTCSSSAAREFVLF